MVELKLSKEERLELIGTVLSNNDILVLDVRPTELIIAVNFGGQLSVKKIDITKV